MLNNITNIVDVLRANGNQYIDDHGHGDNRAKAKVVAQHGTHVVLLHPDAKYFSINRLYLDQDGDVHLSSLSVGGVLDLRGCNLETAIAVYNNPENRRFCPDRPDLSQVTYL